jgi:uncharacterized protein YjlB
MYLKESLKKTIETVTGIGKPSAHAVEARVRVRKPDAAMFVDDGAVANNPRLPFILYRGAVDLSNGSDPAAVFEELFRSNGWGNSWRNGIYGFVHYHSSAHEVLGIARGSAKVRFGGDHGKVYDLCAGDVVVLPAGTGHQSLSASKDLLVVGAYPPGAKYDECRGSPKERERALQSIPRVPLPQKDPVYGTGGPLLEAWAH